MDITEKREVKYLGIIIDENLKWNKQIQNIKENMRKLKYTIMKIRKVKLTESMRKTIYHNIIESKMTYAIEIWGNVGKLKQLQEIQDKMLKLMFNKKEDINVIRSEMKIMNCQQIITEKLVKKSWNILDSTEVKRGIITLEKKEVKEQRERRKTTEEYLKDAKQNNKWGDRRPKTKMTKIINKLMQLKIIDKEEIEKKKYPKKKIIKTLKDSETNQWIDRLWQ